MLDIELLRSIATQMLSGTSVDLQGQSIRVRRTSSQRLKTVAFDMDGRKYEAIEQNPDKPSQWGKLASSGHQVVQFKDVQSNKFVAVSVDGKVKEYGIQSRQKKSAS